RGPAVDDGFALAVRDDVETVAEIALADYDVPRGGAQRGEALRHALDGRLRKRCEDGDRPEHRDLPLRDHGGGVDRGEAAPGDERQDGQDGPCGQERAT